MEVWRRRNKKQWDNADWELFCEKRKNNCSICHLAHFLPWSLKVCWKQFESWCSGAWASGSWITLERAKWLVRGPQLLQPVCGSLVAWVAAEGCRNGLLSTLILLLVNVQRKGKNCLSFCFPLNNFFWGPFCLWCDRSLGWRQDATVASQSPGGESPALMWLGGSADLLL